MSASELSIQTTLRSRARIICPAVRLVAIPNGGKRSRWAASQVKREGLAKGFPDLIALAPGGKVAFLEIKSAKGRVSVDQAEWHEALAEMGFDVGVFRDADDALAWLRGLGFPFINRSGL